MDSLLAPLHLVLVSLWLGCVLTEALFERALLGTGRANELLLAKLHRKVDLLIEIPAFTGAAITGGLLFARAPSGPLLYAKVALGLLAVAANVVCVRLVFARVAYAETGNWTAFERADHLQHKWGALVLVGIVGALGLGLHRVVA